MIWRTVIYASLIALLTADPTEAADLPAMSVQNGYKYLKVRERTNNNDHPDIDRMLAYLGLPKGLSWCAAFSIWNYKESADALHVKQPFPKYGRVAMLWDACQRNPLKYRSISADEVRLGTVQLHAGDLPVWSHGTVKTTRNGQRDFNGHTGLVIEQLSPRTFRSIEGNTQPGPGGNQREGGGVYVRERAITPGSFKIQGFCRAR